MIENIIEMHMESEITIIAEILLVILDCGATQIRDGRTVMIEKGVIFLTVTHT